MKKERIVGLSLCLLVACVSLGCSDVGYVGSESTEQMTSYESDTTTCTTTAPHEHGALEDWLSDTDKHWKLCFCGEVMESAEHNGGEATTEARAICDICGAEYGALVEETERTTETEEPVETEETVDTEAPVETEGPVETETPVETEGTVETEEPVETETTIETEGDKFLNEDHLGEWDQ